MSSKLNKEFKSPNYEDRTENSSIDFLIFHYTACDLKTSLKILCDPTLPHRVSSHYLIDEEGTVYQLVEEKYRAWHAGRSFWQGITDINSHSIGVEIVNLGPYPSFHPFPRPQMNSVLNLTKEIIKRYSIRGSHILGHSDIAPGRKIDPGPCFEWKWLAENGVGIYPFCYQLSAVKRDLEIKKVQEKLAAFGYNISITGMLDSQTEIIIRTFQAHYWSDNVDGKMSIGLLLRLDKLLELKESEGIIKTLTFVSN